MTKSAGCFSAEDRVVVENNVSRPQYIEFLTLDAAGIAGDIYGNSDIKNEQKYRSRGFSKMLPSNNSFGITGQFGSGSGYTAETRVGCHRTRGNSGFVDLARPGARLAAGFVDLARPGARPAGENDVEHYQMAQNHQRNRQAASMQTGFNSYNRMRRAGFRN
jgi:hypothetical protein